MTDTDTTKSAKSDPIKPGLVKAGSTAPTKSTSISKEQEEEDLLD